MRGAEEFAARTGLPKDEVWKAWLPGPSKIWLNELEHRFNRPTLDRLRKLGVRVPIAPINYWGGEGLYSLPSLAESDIIDVHSYGGEEALSADPRRTANYIPWIGAGQVVDKPLSITEWNVEYPTTDRFTAPMYLASIASLQGWDAPMIYNYSQIPFGRPEREDKWSTYFDPAISASMPAAALAYRQGHVRPARREYCLDLSREQVYLRGLDPGNSATIRTLVEQSKLSIGLPDIPELTWDVRSRIPKGTQIVNDPNRDFIPAGQTYVQSDTGELRRDWQQGVQTIDTAMTQAAVGWIGGKAVRLRDVAFDIRTPKASVTVTSLTGKPIRTSNRLLVTTVARVVASEGERTPLLSEPVTGRLSLRTSGKNPRVVPISGIGQRGTPLMARLEKGLLTFELPARGTHWYEVTLK
jgi:hypothetical protein